MGVPFDHIAISDSETSQKVSGQLQRKLVWSYIRAMIPHMNGHEMLELNCGSGDDSVMFGEHGCNLIATDIGAEMMKVTPDSADRFSMANSISTHYLDLETLDATLFNKKFDLVFSNFDTVNSTSPESLKLLFQKIPAILNPGGRFIAVIMPKICLWESCYFLLKMDLKNIFRRTRKEGEESSVLKEWFYNPSEIRKWSKEKFRFVNIKPVGLTLPPVRLDNFLSFSNNALLKLGNLEKVIANIPFLARFSDHFIVDLELK